MITNYSKMGALLLIPVLLLAALLTVAAEIVRPKPPVDWSAIQVKPHYTDGLADPLTEAEQEQLAKDLQWARDQLSNEQLARFTDMSVSRPIDTTSVIPKGLVNNWEYVASKRSLVEAQGRWQTYRSGICTHGEAWVSPVERKLLVLCSVDKTDQLWLGVTFYIFTGDGGDGLKMLEYLQMHDIWVADRHYWSCAISAHGYLPIYFYPNVQSLLLGMGVSW